MENKLMLPRDAVNKLKCHLCQKYLSTGPIMTISEDGTRYKCGRCKNVKTNIAIKNLCFENVAAFLTFPCIYNNCEETVPWDQAQHHEINCPHRTISCPINWEKCEESIEVLNLQEHFEKKHKTRLFLDTLYYDVACDVTDIALLVSKNLQLFVYFYLWKNLVAVSVFCIKSCSDRMKFSVQLASDQRENGPAIVYNHQPIFLYNESEHCPKCMLRRCNVKYHRYSEVYNESEKFMEIFPINMKKDHVRNLLQTSKISFTVNITDEGVQQKSESQHEITELYSNCTKLYKCNSRFRQNLECPICREYMSAPIFNCKIGHVLCHICRGKLEKCPSCKEDIGESRNFVVESILKDVELPCMYDSNGCTFYGFVDMLVQHEASCLFKTEA